MSQQHTFGKECPVCGHISYYDKNIVCRENTRKVYRGDNDKKLHQLLLKCKNTECNAEMVHDEDCEKYV
jgi:hypothetical protein